MDTWIIATISVSFIALMVFTFFAGASMAYMNVNKRLDKVLKRDLERETKRENS